MTELYWISKTVVVDWALKELDGDPAATATVAGTVTKPDGVTTAMTATWVTADLVWRLTYDPTMAGLHAYRITATGTADSAEEGTFVVQASLAGALPITLDPTTSIGLARLFATDITEGAPLFTDAQWTGFLTANGGDARRAAAQGLETIAASEVMVSKKIRTQDLQTDGPAVAAELRALAASLRQQADDGYGNTGAADEAGFLVVDYDPNAWLTAEL